MLTVAWEVKTSFSSSLTAEASTAFSDKLCGADRVLSTCGWADGCFDLVKGSFTGHILLLPRILLEMMRFQLFSPPYLRWETFNQTVRASGL
jgi:hypothetical protein